MRFALINVTTLCFAGHGLAVAAASSALGTIIDTRAQALESRVIGWRRDIHQHPELGNREFRTAAVVAAHLRRLGLEVRTNVAHTGVLGVLHGSGPGRVVALRADMDALPVTEQVDLPFASKVRTNWNGQEVGVMHACGHDAHVAILMGVAELLAGLREQWPGTVKCIFQPAEEGPPRGEEGGADLMIREGALDDPRPEAIFGLHVYPGAVGTIGWRAGAFMASSDSLRITVRGRQTHGAQPWKGVDPIVVGAQIVLGLQTIVSRQIDLTVSPAVITIGSFHGGVRSNIIPEEVVMEGTIRALDEAVRREVHHRVRDTVEAIARSGDAQAEVVINEGNPVTFNDPALARRMRPTLERVVGAGQITEIPAQTVAEDFSLYQQRIPGLFFYVSASPGGPGAPPPEPNHSPRFVVDERALAIGLRALAHLAADFLTSPVQVDQP
jgi:amidohydrolase